MQRIKKRDVKNIVEQLFPEFATWEEWLFWWANPDEFEGRENIGGLCFLKEKVIFISLIDYHPDDLKPSILTATLIHEIIHAVVGCYNHGKIFTSRGKRCASRARELGNPLLAYVIEVDMKLATNSDKLAQQEPILPTDEAPDEPQ